MPLGVNIMQISNLKIHKNKMTSLLLSGALAFTLVGCASTNKADTSSSSLSQNTKSEETIIKKNIDNANNAVEAAIGIMIEGTEKLAESSEKAKQTESYKEAKEEAINNFITLSEFLRGETEIAGYNIDEVEDSTKEYAINALNDLDDDLERIYPNYKEELKAKGIKLLDWFEEKGTDTAAKIYDKYQDLKQKTLEKSKNNK